MLSPFQARHGFAAMYPGRWTRDRGVYRSFEGFAVGIQLVDRLQAHPRFTALFLIVRNKAERERCSSAPQRLPSPDQTATNRG
jgi:hypothetical protein